MKVKDLIEQLKELDGDTLVVMSSDSEGNNFSPLSSLSSERYVAETTWAGELVDEEEDDEEPNAVDSVVLWPTQ